MDRTLLMATGLVLLCIGACTRSNLSADTDLDASSETTMIPAPELGDGGAPEFYSMNTVLPERPGVLIRSESLTAAQSLEKAEKNIRLLYSSTDVWMASHARWCPMHCSSLLEPHRAAVGR